MAEPSPSARQLEEMVAAADTGARAPASGAVAKFLAATAMAWSLFQIWIASPLPFIFGFGIFNDTEARSIHLAFAVFLAFLAYPALKKSPRSRIPAQDWIMAAAGAFCAAYLFVFYVQISDRPSNPNTPDIIAAIVGMILLLEATRRALGPPLMVVAMVFLAYTFGGPHMPGLLAWKGASFGAVASHQWVSTEGVFGIALGVSTSFVFLFVLFGSLLDKAGAGNYFIKVAFSLLGHQRGGPAKAAVVSSAMTGLISGSSIANVVTTGTFTIPMMKRVGFPGVKAGAVEVAASTNGQLTPPIMGAAAFLMVEYVGISYVDVIRHAVLPAVISYIALVYIVHLEALKAKMQGLPRRAEPSPLLRVLMRFLFGFIVVAVTAFAVYYLFGWIKPLAGAAAGWIIAALVAAFYVALAYSCARHPDLKVDDPNAPLTELPPVGPTVKSGLHFLLPVVVLVWCLMVERLSPALSAFWATALMVFILVTQRPLFALFRGAAAADIKTAAMRGAGELRDGLIGGARNMIGIGVATAAAGIIVGAVSQTGVGGALAQLVEILSLGNVLLMLLLTAFLSLVLGMGLPTTANYIVVSSLLAPVIVTLGQQSGLIVPLIAVHLFVFYFGILADDTPPVGLAAFAASAISRADPIRTGIQGFTYDIRTAILPFLFIFNTDLLLIDVNWFEGVAVFVVATVAMLVFASATQGFLLVKNRVVETLLLLLVAFTLFRPGFWMDLVAPPLVPAPPQSLVQVADGLAAGDLLRLRVDGFDDVGAPRSFVAVLPLGEGGDGAARLQGAGLETVTADGKVVVDSVAFDSAAQEAGLDFDQVVTEIMFPAAQPPKQLMFIPALLVLCGIIFLQRRRRVPEV